MNNPASPNPLNLKKSRREKVFEIIGLA